MTLFKKKANKEIELTPLDELTALLEEFSRVNKCLIDLKFNGHVEIKFCFCGETNNIPTTREDNEIIMGDIKSYYLQKKIDLIKQIKPLIAEYEG